MPFISEFSRKLSRKFRIFVKYFAKTKREFSRKLSRKHDNENFRPNPSLKTLVNTDKGTVRDGGFTGTVPRNEQHGKAYIF
jgi:hypothetical protein